MPYILAEYISRRSEFVILFNNIFSHDAKVMSESRVEAMCSGGGREGSGCWTSGVAGRREWLINEVHSVPTHDDLTMQLTLHHASYLKLLHIRGNAKSFQSNEAFIHSQKPGSSSASIPEFAIDSHPAY
jgi:hypothetical protein